MQTIRSVDAFYPAFHLGGQPQAVPCTLRIIEANGKRYLKTPFAMLDAYADDDIERQFERACGWPPFYRTAEDCWVYLTQEYPWATQAEPIMHALCNARHYDGELVGTGKVADKLGVSDLNGELFRLARGHNTIGLKRVKAAVKLLH